jgi:hypothetical protein
MKPRPALKKMRFVACARGIRLLQVSAQAAGNAPAGGTVLISPVGFGFSGRKNLTRSGIYRGKISRRNNQNHLEEKTRHRRPIK